MKATTRLSVLLIATISLFSCKKESEKSTVELLTLDDWKITALTCNPPLVVDSVEYSDIYNEVWQACQRDNLLTFVKNGALITDEGALKCNPNAEQQSLSSWYLNPEENKLTADSVEVVIVELTKDRLIVEMPANLLGTVTTLTAVLEH